VARKVVGEIVERESTICQKCFRFLCRDQVVLVTKSFYCGGNGVIVQLQIHFIGALFGFDAAKKFLPFRIQLAPEKRRVDCVASRIFLISTRTHDQVIVRN